MRIMILDIEQEHEFYRQAFGTHNYEENQLILVSCFQEAKEMLVNQLATQKHHIDLIITGQSAFSDGGDILKARELLFLKNSLTESYSHGNFRVCAIPIVLYTEHQGLRIAAGKGDFDAKVGKNSSGNYLRLIGVAESVVRRWRSLVMDDLDVLTLRKKRLENFTTTPYFRKTYQPAIVKHAEQYFFERTSVVSLEFIRCPQALQYDWTTLNSGRIEQQLNRFGRGFRFHKQYNRYDSENTILHPLLKENNVVLMRHCYDDFLHEVPFPQQNGLSKRCDFILRPGLPEHLKTNWFEVKKENVHYFTGRRKKDKYLSADMHHFLGQLWKYKKYAEDPLHASHIEDRLGYTTNNFTYSLLVGRGEEKLAFGELLQEALGDHYPGIEVLSYEDLEVLCGHYLDRFDRLAA